MKLFVYSGFWSYAVEANSREEADAMFDAAKESEFDHNYDYVEVEEIKEGRE